MSEPEHEPGRDLSWGEILKLILFNQEIQVLLGCLVASCVAIKGSPWIPDVIAIPMFMSPMFGFIWVGWYSKG